MKVQFFMPISHAVACANLQNTLLKRFGGFTAIPGTGQWLSPEGEAIIEPVEVITILCENVSQLELHGIAWKFGEEAQQQSVLYAIDDVAHFVDTAHFANQLAA